jgi:DNA uptake protein ComE-like DNA-binding protein
MEKNLRSDGTPRVNINQEDLNLLYEELSAVVPPEWATYIVAYRLNGPYTGSSAGQKRVTGVPYINGTGKAPITQVLDLIGKKVQAKLDGSSENTVIESPFENNPIAMAFYMPLLMDAVTVNPSPFIPGRININQAPEPILRGIPGITEEIVQEILASRAYETPEEKPNRRFETWLLVEGIVSDQEMRLLMPFICGGGDVHRAQVVGYFDGGGPSSRAEVVIDASGVYPRVLFWRDLGHLGRGYALETLGVEVEVQ